MAQAQLDPFLQHIRHLMGTVPAAAMSDRQLLEQFLATRDETAVEVLVRRYGPLVLGVCRRVLRDGHAAEDAFQATFLVLIRKAPELVCCKRLGGWLHRVAYRLALRARATEARRRQCEANAARMRADIPGRSTMPGDIVVALEEVLQNLPQKHRLPLVLCYLEGKTNDEAAQLLGCPRGSISARLAQARECLRTRLAQRGYAVASPGIPMLLTTATAHAAVPLPLLSNTVRAAQWFAGAEAGSAGFVSSHALALASGACEAIFVNKLKIAGAVLLAAAMLGASATMLVKAGSPPRHLAYEFRERLHGDSPDRAAVPKERLPDGVVARLGSTKLRHGDAISLAAFTPDGKALVTAGRDKTICLWDLATGQEIRRFHWDVEDRSSKPGASEDGTAQRWEQQFWDLTARSIQAALSPDGKTVAASQGGVVCLWETATGRKLRGLQTCEKRLLQLAFSADGRSLLTLGPGQATAIWDVATGKCKRITASKPADPIVILPDAMDRIAVVSPGWKYLAFQESDKVGATRCIKIMDLATGNELAQIPTTPAATAIAFTSDDKTLVWFQLAGAIVLSDAATGKELRRLRSVAANMTTDIALAPDCKSLAVSRADHTVELWDLTLGKLTGHIGTATNVDQVKSNADIVGALVRPAVAFSPDGRKLVSSLGGAVIRQFHADTGAEIPGPASGHHSPVSTLFLSSGGRSLCTFGRGEPLRFWDRASGRQAQQRMLPSSTSHLSFAEDGRFAFADGAGVAICSANSEERLKIDTASSRLIAFALSPDGAWLATRSGSGREVHLWETATQKERHTLGWAGEEPEVRRAVLAESTGVKCPDLLFSPDGRYLAAAGPKRQLCFWDLATGNLLWECSPQTGETIERFAFSRNGFSLATLNGDGTVTLYETVTGKKRGQLGKPSPKSRTVDLTGLSSFSYLGWRQDAPVCLAFSHDGHYLAMAKDTPDIDLWDVIAGRKIAQLQGHEGSVVSLLFTPDGKHLISGGTDTTALIWDLSLKGVRRRPRDVAARIQGRALDTLWTDLAGQDAARAFDAMRELSAAPIQAVKLIKDRVRPTSAVHPNKLVQFLADLESDRFELRRQAESELERHGALAEPALRKVLAGNPSQDLRKRAERLLDNLSGRVPPAGVVRDLRAVELLELIGTSEARQVLQTLASGVPSMRLTREAQSALERLTKQVVAP
jgi:RNA polymerase sigma factor (sigma-70 family)